MAIVWNEEYSVGVKEIDDQHKHFVMILDNLTKTFYSGGDELELEEVFKELMLYAGFHFSTEEKYFREFKYEGADEHIKEHRRIIFELEKMEKENEKDHLQRTIELVDFLEDWLVIHLSDMDKKYTKCFNDHGLD
jgi:hemerythrin